jgi:hypothetical protein
MYKHPYLQLLQVSVLLFAVLINVVPGNPATETEYHLKRFDKTTCHDFLFSLVY